MLAIPKPKMMTKAVYWISSDFRDLFLGDPTSPS